MIPKTMVFKFSHALEAGNARDPQIVGQENADRYYHIRTPLKRNDLVMFRFDLEGYAYGASLPLDITWCGYNYDWGSVIH